MPDPSKTLREFTLRCTIAVDVHLLNGGGVNGGIKPAIYEQLGWIATRYSARLDFLFLANRKLAPELRS